MGHLTPATVAELGLERLLLVELVFDLPALALAAPLDLTEVLGGPVLVGRPLGHVFSAFGLVRHSGRVLAGVSR